MALKYKSELLGATLYPDLKTILFYGGIFSQWAESYFDIDIGEKRVKVNSAEQAMMLKKAHVFNDEETFDLILNASHPRDQKALGRMVKNFDPVVWEDVAYDWVVKVNYEKFSQNKAWKELLILTEPYSLVEASPYDRIWGIGFGEDNPEVFDKRDEWGKNLLGQAIVQARIMIIDKLSNEPISVSRNYKTNS